jgi:hypothetical protein
MEYRNKLALGGVCLALMLSGCSDNDSSRSTVSAVVKVGHEDIDAALVRSIAVQESGLPAVDAEGRVSPSASYTTNDEGRVSVSVPSEEIQLFRVLGRVEKSESDIDPTLRLCQWVAGCGETPFAQWYPVTTELDWRSVVRDLSSDETIRVTPLTDLAAELAFERQYLESVQDANGGSGFWVASGYYTDYSVEQAISQLSRLFGILNVQTSAPADLTDPASWDGSDAVANQDKLRYGAIVAALQGMAFDNPSILSELRQQLVEHDGQLRTSGDGLTLVSVYQAAIDNLNQLSELTERAAQYRTAVVTALQEDIVALQQMGELTAVKPASVTELLGGDLEDFTLGLARTKAFVDRLQNLEGQFFEEGYRPQLDAYLEQMKALGDEHADNLDAVVQAFIQTQELYVACYADAAQCNANGRDWPWLQSVDGFDGEILRLNGGAIEVAQQPADINATDDEDEPAESQAIDVLIKGQYQQGDLRFVVDHYYEDDDSDEPIESPAGVRLYYSQASASVQPGNEVIAYELRWPDFQMYDVTDLGTAQETEVSGSYILFLRGVKDPQNPDSERRFNIDSVILNGRISDVVSDDNDDDDEKSVISLTASAVNADEFYPAKRFASFNGFFTPHGGEGFEKGSMVADLVQYQLGSETIAGQDVEYLDFIVRGGDAERYRFYPTVERTDDKDRDNDDDRSETYLTHDREVCDLVESGEGWQVDSCQPKVRALEPRDRDDLLNDLWKAGVLSRVQVPGRGIYFIDWPAEQGTDQCLQMSPIADSGVMSGTLYEPMVLGLNSLRFSTELDLEYGIKGEPRTLLSATVTANTLEDYSASVALSHDYNSISGSDLLVGSGGSLDRIIVSYATNRTFDIRGSLAVYQDGVNLTLADGEVDKIDSELSLVGVQDRELTPLPYRYVIDEDGNYDRCVIANQAEFDTTTKLEDMVFNLNFRDTVYGQVRNENGVWVVRYIDGTFETLM